MMVNEADLDLRFQGLPHSVVKHAQSTSRELIHKIENHPDRHALQQGHDRINHLIPPVPNQNKWFGMLGTVMADFGQTDFGQPFWRPSLAKPTLARVSVLVVWPTLAKPTLAKPTLAKPTLANTDFGQTEFGQNRLWPNRLWPNRVWFVVWCVVLCCVLCVVLCVVWVAWVLVSRYQSGVPCFDRPSRDRPSPGPPKMSLFFFPSPAANFVLFFSLWVFFSLNFGGVFEGRDPQMCTFGLSGCRVKPRRPHQTGPPGLAHDSPRTPNVHISGPRRIKHHQNSTRRPPEREEKNEFCGGRGKKSAKFWAPHPSGPHPSGPWLA